MSEFINKYNTTKEYQGDTQRVKNQSSISMIGDKVNYDGVNINSAQWASVADAVYVNEDTSETIFIDHNTLNAQILPPNLKPVGVVIDKQGDNLVIAWWKSTSQKYASIYRWEVDAEPIIQGKSTVYQITLQEKPIGEFSCSAKTIDEFSSEFNTFIKSKRITSHHTYVKDGKLYLVFDEYSTSIKTTAIGDLTLTPAIATEVSVNGSFINKYGNSSGRVFSIPKAIDYFTQDNESSSYNPDSVVQGIPSYPVCLPGYLGKSQYRTTDCCKWLRDKFGEGREGWLNYLNNIKIMYPLKKGAQAIEDTLTEQMKSIANETYITADGKELPIYSAFHYCAEQGYMNSEFPQGSFFMIGIGRLSKLMNTITYGATGITKDNCDSINKTLLKMDGSTISCGSNRWLPSRYSSQDAWSANGYGYVDFNYFYYSYSALPVSLYKIAKR